MEFLGHHLIVTLKKQFWDIFETEITNDDYLIIIQEMLQILHRILDAAEITLYSCDEWNHQWIAQASTGEKERFPCLSKSIINNCEVSKEKEQIIYNALTEEKLLIGNDVLLFITQKEKINSFLVLRPSERSQWEEHLLYAVTEECRQFLFRLQHSQRVLLQETRYKLLYRVTKKVHSSMKMEAVLGEIIYTLKEVYPTFSYDLLLSHDNNYQGDLPIKDLEYDSDNTAAIEAFVNGESRFEKLQEEQLSIMYTPLKGKQGVYGVLKISALNAKFFPENEVEFITLLANTAGGALENAQLYQQSKKLVADLQLINEVSHQLNSNLRLTEIMHYMSERICSSFAAEEVGFILFSTESQTVTVLPGSTSYFQNPVSTLYINHFKEKILIERDSFFIGDFNMALVDTPYRSIMVVPMMQTGILKGFAIVLHPNAYHFSFETFKLLQSLIHHSTLALTNSMLKEELEKMVVTDHLTKLYSRNYLDEKVQCSLVEDKEGTFILVDIDDFKVINDTYGHQVGDEIIIQVANIILENMRSSDIGSRWGGEELAIYLPKVPLQVGVAIAERLVERVRTTSSPSVTISCGVSYWNEKKPDNYHTIFRRADKALYVAKESGKNRVIVQDTYLVSE